MFRVELLAAGVQLFEGAQVLLLVDVSQLLEILTVLVFEVGREAQELSIHDTVIQMSLQILHIHRLSLLGETEESNSVSDQFPFHLLVERTVCAETWTMINF